MYDDILTLLGLSASTVPENVMSQISTIIAIVSGRLEAKLSLRLGTKVTEVPAELTGIVEEICVQRYNRVGSEGMGSHTVEGESNTWVSEDYFAPYESDIDEYVDAQKAAGKSPHIKFL